MMTDEKANQQVQTDIQVTEPNRYNVLFMNDDYTPIDFVQGLLTCLLYTSPSPRD